MNMKLELRYRMKITNKWKNQAFGKCYAHVSMKQNQKDPKRNTIPAWPKD
jgi:hypothetical protein